MRYYHEFYGRNYVQTLYANRPDYVQHMADTFGVMVPYAVAVGPDNDVWVCFDEAVSDPHVAYVHVGFQGDRQ